MFTLLNFCTDVSAQKKSYIVAIGASKDDTAVAQRFRKLVDEISKLSELDLIFQVQPPARGDENFRYKRIDATLARIKEYQEKYPDALMVKEPFGTVDYYAYSYSPDTVVNSLADLTNYSIAAVRGNSINVYYKDIKELFLLNSNEEVIKFVHAQRADVLISNDLILKNQADDLQNIVNGFYKSTNPIITKSHYTFFQSGFEDAAAKFEAALKELKANGTYHKIIIEGVLD